MGICVQALCSSERMRQQVITLLAVSGMILAFRPGMTSETDGRVSRHERSTRVGSDAVVAAQHSAWRDYAGGPDGAQYSALDQINRSNVSQLRVAWSYPTGDGSKYLFNPIVVDRMMYVLARDNSIVALDATTGSPVWVHPNPTKTHLITNRGINYWESSDHSEGRLLFAVDNSLQAIDARTGQSIMPLPMCSAMPASLLTSSNVPSRRLRYSVLGSPSKYFG